jgi:hypothetical protein
MSRNEDVTVQTTRKGNSVNKSVKRRSKGNKVSNEGNHTVKTVDKIVKVHGKKVMKISSNKVMKATSNTILQSPKVLVKQQEKLVKQSIKTLKNVVSGGLSHDNPYNNKKQINNMEESSNNGEKFYQSRVFENGDDTEEQKGEERRSRVVRRNNGYFEFAGLKNSSSSQCFIVRLQFMCNVFKSCVLIYTIVLNDTNFQF